MLGERNTEASQAMVGSGRNAGVPSLSCLTMKSVMPALPSQKRWAWRQAALPAAMLLLAACTPKTDIRQILADPRAYEGKTVTLDGEVTETFSLLIIKYFRLDDGTGSIGVVSDNPLPAKGQRMKVTGEVREAFSLGDKNLTVVMEQSAAKERQR